MHNNIKKWLKESRKKLKTNTFSDTDLDKLSDIVSTRVKKKQRLLYLHAASPSIRSEVIAMALHEPAEGSITKGVICFCSLSSKYVNFLLLCFIC